MEDDPVAVPAFQFGPIHARTDVLDGIEHVDTALDETGDQRPHRAVGMIEHLEAVAVDQLTPAHQTVPEIALPHFR